MPIEADDIRIFYTVATGPGGSAPQPDPAASLGRFASHTDWEGTALNDLFAPYVTTPPVGHTDYRAVFVCNRSLTETAYNVRVYWKTQPEAQAELLVGVDPAGVVDWTEDEPQGGESIGGLTAPSGVLFASPQTYEAGVAIGTLEPGQGRMIWIRRTATGVAAGSANIQQGLLAIGFASEPSP